MRLSWILMLLALVLTGVRAGEAGAEAGAKSAPAIVPVPHASSAPTSSAAQASVEAAVSAAEIAPIYSEYRLVNGLIQVDVSDRRGAILNVSLLKTHPIHLRAWQTKVIEAKGQVTLDPAKPLPVLSHFNRDSRFHNWIREESLEGEQSPWKRISGDDHHLVLQHNVPTKGLRYTLTYELFDGSLAVHSALTIENIGAETTKLHPFLYPLNGVHQDDLSQDLAYLALAHHNGGIKGKMVSLYLPAVPAPGTPRVNTIIPGDQLDYICLKSRFFAALWQPVSFEVGDAKAITDKAVASQPAAIKGDGGPGSATVSGPNGTVTAAVGPLSPMKIECVGFLDRNGAQQAYVQVALLSSNGGELVLKPSQKFDAKWNITVASMTEGDLALLGETAAKVEFTDGYYRFFKSLAWLLTISLDFLVMIVQNYGVAVVALTFLIKALLHRFTFKQQESMMKMQKLAPDLKLLQEQYKNDKAKIAQKQMELWKKHGVNPLGGCLPVLIQIPIFTALYLTFCHSADMRGAGFLWVNDLTLPDQDIGWMIGGWMISINPLPLIYIGVSIWMSLMQKMPTGGDPQQEQTMKIMRWLPVVFGVIFYNMPSGLVLYFTINAVLSTIEIKMVRKKLGLP